MLNDNDLEQIKEGITKTFAYKKKYTSKGPGIKDKLPFYNPSMELNRDFSILIAQWLINNQNRKINILDGLAASGIRGIRFANELEGEFEVTINDWNIDAISLIKKNLEFYNFNNVILSNKNINVLLSEKKYDYIDIDPFGSPIYYADSAFRSIKNNGIIAFTATDTAALCGVYPKVCMRRYYAKPFHSFIMHEVGLRILIGFICREAAKYDIGIKPLISYTTDHYFRLYITVKKGAKYTNEVLKKIGIAESKKVFPDDDKENVEFGPLWFDSLHNINVTQDLQKILSKKKLNTRNQITNLIDVFIEESNAPMFFYTTDYLASIYRNPPLKNKTIFEKLKNEGYKVFRTHFNNKGFKTDAPMSSLKKITRKH